MAMRAYPARMSRRPAKFTESDVRRVLTAAKKADCAVRISIERDGKIVILAKPAEPLSDEASSSSSWDEAVAKLGG